MKKVLILLLVLLLAVSIFPTSAIALDDGHFQVGDYIFKLDVYGRSAIITDYVGADSTLWLPNTVTYGNHVYNVISVGDGAFRAKDLRSVYTNMNLLTIGEYAFANNPLHSAYLGENLGSIGDYAFSGCALTDVNIPNTIIYLGKYAYESQRDADGNRTLRTLTFGDDSGTDSVLQTISEGAFYDNDIYIVRFPDSIITIGAEAFAHNQLVNLGSFYWGYNIRYVYADAFAYNNIFQVAFNERLFYLDDGCFRNNSIRSLAIPASVLYIGDYAFYEMRDDSDVKSLSSLTFAESSKVLEIGDYAFQSNRIESLILPPSLDSLGAYAFQDNSLTSIDFSDNTAILEIKAGTFKDNSISSITIPSNIREIYEEAFQNNEIASVSFPQYLLYIGDSAFQNNELASVSFPQYLEYIGNNAFQNNDLPSVTIPRNVRYIGRDSFSGNILSTFDLPSPPSFYFILNAWQDENLVWRHAGETIRNLGIYFKFVGTPFSYKITLDNQGVTADSTLYVYYNYPMPKIPAPSKAGYSFLGYFTETDGGGTRYYYANMSGARNWDIRSGTTLYAYWEALEHRVDFDTQGASSVSHQMVPDGTYAQKPDDPTKSGYLFGGWYTDSECGDDNKWNFAKTPVTSDMTLYAKWGSVAVSSLEIAGDASITLSEGERHKLTAGVYPQDATYDDVAWTTSNAAIASISADGTVTAVAEGTCTITAEADEKYDTCEVTVTEKDVATVSLSYGTKSLYVGDTFALSAIVLPNDASNPELFWESSDTSVAKVTSLGVVEAVGSGKCTVSAAADGKSDSCQIIVTTEPETTPEPLPPAYVNSVSLAINSNTVTILYVGDTVDLVANVLPSNAQNKALTWESSDKSVATVSSLGHVRAIGVGSASITVSAGGHSDTYNISVKSRETELAPSVPPAPSPPAEQPDVQPKSLEYILANIDTAALPDGTAYLLLPCGDTVDISDDTIMRIKVPCEDVGENDNLELIALNDERVPLGSVNVAVAGSNSGATGIASWIIVLIVMGTLLAGVAGTLAFMKISQQNK